ncbi:magnesium-translocating P-type ATPase [Caulobacter sp. KR2-114]|uniref:magnesium-translocating P-type ATPase n=1 Tax=Caulobacter sp. KR2-114 TaxID=3400912 RepID=UPI003C060432
MAAGAATAGAFRDATGDRQLRDVTRLDPAAALSALKSSDRGLEPAEAAARVRTHGPNRVAEERRLSVWRDLAGRLRNPLNLLLIGLALTSVALGDLVSGAMIAAMVALSVGLGHLQEHRSSEAAAKLAAMVRVRASVLRPGSDRPVEGPIEDLAPGDVVALAAGDLAPADLRLIASRDLFVDQSALSGESMPAEKHAEAGEAPPELLDAANLVFMGSSVTSGAAQALVVATGRDTRFGRLADATAAEQGQDSFQRGIDGVALLMLRLIAVMAPLVFLINGLTKHDWLQALFFAVAVAVGLTPEMLPMIVTVNLAQGALAMARKRVVVKRLNAIQNFGAMDVLCTDKTGTLTENRVALKLHLDVLGHEDEAVLFEAYLNARFQTGLRNLLDDAVLAHEDLDAQVAAGGFHKLDELPFDFVRRRLSVVVGAADGRATLICKGAVEEVFACCTRYRLGGEEGPLDDSHARHARELVDRLNADGVRVVAVACRDFPASHPQRFTVADESGLTLLGYIGFLDPPKADAAEALAALARSGVKVKVLTGDNGAVTRRICHDVGLAAEHVVLGQDIAGMDDTALTVAVEANDVFAKLTPEQKARVIRALQRAGHVTGFLGDGINDAPALKAADVGLSVDDAVDIAKAAADIILLEKSLSVLRDGVLEGRRVFANVLKYIRMGTSSNFGNMFSVLGASLFLPFLPMAPIQVLTNNLLYDISQSGIPSDNVDPEALASPRRWELGGLLRFVLLVGPVSSIFDYATFGLMIFVFHAWTHPALFQTGWFVESLLTQTLIVHVIRTARTPFFQSRASRTLTFTSLAVCVVGVSLPYSPLAGPLGFTPLPLAYWPAVTALMAAYAVSAHLMKRWFVRRWGY